MYSLGVLLVYIFIAASFQLANSECIPSVTKVGGSQAKISTICSGALIFEEQFDNLNQNLWNHESQVDGAGNGEFQQYVNDRSISYVKDGNLFIKPKVIGDGPLHDGYFNPVQSARMTTAGKFNFKYGRLEARAQIPAGDWIWPAIWMMPQDSAYGGWPRSGEIDIVESRGNKNLIAWGGNNIGTQSVSSTLHWGKNSNEDQYQRTSYEKKQADGYDLTYHNYSLIWTPDYISLGIDNEEIGRVIPPNGGFYEFGHLSGDNPWEGSKMAPFDREFFLIINVAIGGTNGYFPDDCSNPNGKPWKNWSKQAARDFWNGNWQWRPTWNEGTDQSALKVDYVRVWAL